MPTLPTVHKLSHNSPNRRRHVRTVNRTIQITPGHQSVRRAPATGKIYSPEQRPPQLINMGAEIGRRHAIYSHLFLLFYSPVRYQNGIKRCRRGRDVWWRAPRQFSGYATSSINVYF
jgi:hypothetical protein